MADYNQNIKVTADTRSAERSIDQLANKLGKLQNLGSGAGKAASGLRNIGEAFVPQRSLNALERGLQTITNRTNTAEKAFARLVEGVGTLAVSSQVLTGLNQVLKSTANYTGSVADNFSGAANKIDQFASSGSRLEGILGAVNNSLVDIAHAVERSLVPGFAALDDTAQATAKGVNSAQYALQRLLDSSDGLRAFVDNFGSISSATGVATAGLAALAAVVEGQLSNALYDIDKNASNALGQLAADAAAGVSELQRLIRAGQGTVSQYENLLRIGKERQAIYGAESEEGRKAANTIARAQQLLNAELEKQNDLLRAANGLRSQSVENRATNTYNTTQRAKEYRAGELNRLNTELEDYARLAEEVAAQTKAWADNLTRVERSSKAGVLGNKSQIQARLEEMRENNRSAQIARERSAALQGKAYGLNQVPAGGQLFPGGNTMTAQPGYRAVQNAAATYKQAAEAARPLLQQAEQRTILEGKSLQVVRNRTSALREQAAIDANSIAILRQQNAERIKAAQLDERALTVARRQTQLADLRNKKKKGEELQGRVENTLVSGAFPLLFGAGPLATLGGFAGGALGSKNPMIGVFTSAIGQMVDQFAAAAIDMGKSLRDPITNFQKIKDASLLASKSQEYYVQRLIEVGRITEAAAVVQQRVVELVGRRGANDMTAAGAAADRLSKAWAELNLQMQAAISGPLANLLEWITSVVRVFGESGKAGAQVKDLLSGLSPTQQAAFQREMLQNNQRYGTSPKALQEEARIMEKYRRQANTPALSPAAVSPEAQQKAAEAQLSAAERAEALRRQGIQLERQGQDLRISLEDQVFNFRRRAADLERANIDLRRSVEDEIFRKRQEISRIEIDNERQKAQLAVERTDLGLAGLRVNGNREGQDLANGLLEGLREYVRGRGEAEADLRQKERNFTVEMEELKRASENFRFEVARKVSDLQRQSVDYMRDLEKARLATERSIYDLQLAAADYRIAKAKEAIALETQAAQQLQMTQTLTGQVGGVGGRVVAHFHGDPGRPGYDPAGHGTQANAHDHYRFESAATAKRVAAELGKLGYTITELKGVTSVGRHSANGGHYDGTAFDVPWAQFGSGPIGQRDFNRSRQLQADINRILGNQLSPVFQQQQQQPAAANNIVPTGGAPRSVDTTGALSQLNALSAPGTGDLTRLMGAMDQLNAKLINVKTTALALTRDFAAMTETQRAERYGQLVQAAIDNLNAPLDQILTKQGDQVAYQREYAELIAKGTLPALAEEILKIREQVAIQLKQLDTSLAVLEAAKLKLEAEGKWTEELQKQLDLLKEQRSIIEGKGKQAEGGATQAQSSGQRLQDAYTQVQGQLNELNDPVNQIVAGANAIGSAFGTAFKDVASGAKTAQQALADAFQSIANHFLDMAAQMIAKWIEMQILGLAQGLLGGLAGGAAGGAGWGGSGGAGWGGFAGALQMPALMADGAFVNGPTRAVIGEGGTSEYVIPENKMGSAMARWSSGMRGGAVLDGADPTGAGGGVAMAEAPAQINIAGGVLNFNDSQYIKADQIPAIISQGAKQGEAKALRKLQMSPSTRRRVGMA